MHFYDFVSYCSMLTDEKRLDAYVKALKEVITSESVVLDIGAGTGIFSVLACDYGAKKVYSVEINPLIKLLQDVIKERGYDAKIEIINKLSTRIELDEKANILVSDIHGAFPLFESSIETLIDARERLLKKDAVMIPRKETIYFSVSQAEEIYENNIKRYLANFHGFSIPSAERLVFNRWFSANCRSEKLLSDSQVFAIIDHRTNNETSFAKTFEWKIEDDGTAHGLRGWFDNELSDSSGVSNAIDTEKTTYSCPFFPLEREVKVEKGDVVLADISAKYEKGDYTWSWRTKFLAKGNTAKVKAEFNQSVLASMFIDPKVALKESEYYVPKTNETAEVDLFILNSMDGEMLQGDIADALMEKYPKVFKNFETAFNYTISLTHRYSE